ncbi:uncharacterized protein LOC131942082 [Physella acuta]|uniref:uncharacterized protein LOC131942082 n=1 Tax=Physella acuta TaxID=109671 RepID=UPI0027DE9195|nr:uncharacterized protein LOC131942082 [Physella acuta]
MYLTITALCLALLVYVADADCSISDWGRSLDLQGVSKCNDGKDFLYGFYRNGRTSWDRDPLNLLELAECCARNAPWTNSTTQTVYSDWWYLLDRNNSWAVCPAGYFLSGVYRSENTTGLLSNIEEGRCSKPADHPTFYGHCYDQDTTSCFDEMGWCTCNTGYYITGLFRGNCDQLNCLDTLHCCKTASAPETLDEVFDVKSRIMDTTMEEMATLAHYLGFAWCSGCRSPYVGEDFKRNGYRWEADTRGRCEGYKSETRLSMTYGDWSFAVKDIRYGTPITQDLAPETIDSGMIYNNDPMEVTKYISRLETSIRSVTHTTTSSWKNGQELNLKISYTPPSAIGGVGVSVGYTFNYENRTATSDQHKTEQTRKLLVITSKTLRPYTAAKWSLVLSKTRTFTTYMATVIAKFSLEHQGFLRYNGRAGSNDTNYYYQYRGVGNRPTFKYKFGDSSTPFYTALRRQSNTNAYPWMWNDMKSAFPNAQCLIDDLCDENRYVFTVSGMFDDVIGKHAEFRWDSVPLRKRAADRHVQVPDEIFQKSSHVAKAGPNDVPLVKLVPPVVKLVPPVVKLVPPVVKLVPPVVKLVPPVVKLVPPVVKLVPPVVKLVPPVVKLVPPVVNSKVRNRGELEKLTTSG